MAIYAPRVIDEVQNQIPGAFPSHVADSIFNGVKRSISELAAMPTQ